MGAEYSVVIRNGGTDALTNAHVSFGGFISIGGNLSPGIKKIHLDAGRSLPKQAKVEWRTPDGVLHQKQVAVRSRVPRGFAGDLIFTIRDDGEVEFRGETWADQDARVAEEMRRNPPIFEEGELETVANAIRGVTTTVGLGKWDHPELESSFDMDPYGDLVVQLAVRIKRDGARYTPGDRVEAEGQMVCFSEGEKGRLLVEPCSE